jgi:hypothetical protein
MVVGGSQGERDMVKRQRKTKTEAEMAEIEADRIAAHESAVQELDEALSELEDEGIKVVVLEPTEEGMEELHDAIAEAVGEDDAEEKAPVSIVKDKFKTKYAENAAAIGDTRKQVKRSNWDWLSQQLAVACLSEKGKIDIGAFTDVLDANGVDHSRWTNRNRGWEGRFRMTGRVALQKVVANSGRLITPGGTVLEAPAEFREKYKTK